MLECWNKSMKCWIAVLLVTLVCFRGVCAGDDISGSANLTYRSTDTKTGEEEDNSWGFIQAYDLQMTKDFTSKVDFTANLGINVNETNDTKTTLLTPDLRLNIRNEYFDADTGYRITENGLDILTMGSDEDRLTTESWNANFSTKSEKYPRVRLRYNEDRNYDYLALRETDEKTTNFSGSADYEYRFLNFYYDYRNNVLDDYVTECTTETNTHDGRVDFRKSFWKNKIATSGSYSITNTKTETTTGGQEVRQEEKRKALHGLYADDSTPLSGTLNDTYDALKDGDKTTRVTTPTEINIGGGIGNTDQNIGLELSFAEDVELIYLYTEKPDFALSHTAFTWDVYSSADNNNWNLITSNADFEYDTNENRFEISFPKTKARYFKIVNTANDLNDLYVTEIEAYGFVTFAPFTTTETEQTTQTIQANLGYKPTDWLSFTYDFTQDQREETQQEDEPDQEKTSRQTHNATGRVEKQLHKYLTASAQYQKRLEYDSEAEDKTTDTYLLHFLSSPLKTLDTDLSLNHTVSKEDSETQSKSSSALLQISAKLRDGADLDVNANITRSENPLSQSETTTKSVNSNLRLELTRMLTAEIEYNKNWTETENPDDSTTGRTHAAKCTLYWRPSHDFYFRGSYGVDRDENSGDETSQQQYNMSWLMSEKMQLNIGCTLNRNDAVSSTYSSDLSWNLSRTFTLRFSYDLTCQEADETTETQTFSTNLSARF